MKKISGMTLFVFFGRVFVVVLGVWLLIITPIGDKKGRDFPTKDEVQYTEGVFKYVQEKANKSRVYTPIIVPKDGVRGTFYYCSYSAYHTNITSSCFYDEDDVKPYLNQPAKIGWYHQKDFWWFHNPHPQMVSLEVNGEVVKSYEDTVNKLEKNKKRNLIMDGIAYPLFFLAFCFCYWLFGTLTQQQSED